MQNSQLIEQTFLRPGRYRIDEDRFRDFTSDDLRRYAEGTRAALRGGLSIPILREHAAPGAPEGGPRESRDAVASGAGWLVDVRQNDDGSLSQVMEITDAKAAEAIAAGTIKFTSPEIVDSYVDGLGRRYDGLFRHFALTHKPRNPIQGKMRPVTAGALPSVQFSMDDAIQFDGEFNESDHPRADDGKFTSGGRSRAASKPRTKVDRRSTAPGKETGGSDAALQRSVERSAAGRGTYGAREHAAAQADNVERLGVPRGHKKALSKHLSVVEGLSRDGKNDYDDRDLEELKGISADFDQRLKDEAVSGSHRALMESAHEAINEAIGGLDAYTSGRYGKKNIGVVHDQLGRVMHRLKLASEGVSAQLSEDSPVAKKHATQFAESYEDDFEDEDGDPGLSDDVDASAGDGPDGDATAAPPVETNPDLPSEEGDEKQKQQTLEAIVAHLEDLGIVLPAECDLTTEIGLACLLTALKTKVEAEKSAESAEAEKNPGEADDGAPEVAAVSPDNQMQFDERNPQVKSLLSRLAKAKEKLVSAGRSRLVDVIKTVPVPSIRKKLAGMTAAVQFDELGNSRPTFTLEQVAKLFDGFPSNLQFDEAAIMVPDDDNVVSGDRPMSDADAQREVDEQLSRLGMLPRRKPTEWVNTDPHQGLPVTVVGGLPSQGSSVRPAPARRQVAAVS